MAKILENHVADHEQEQVPPVPQQRQQVHTPGALAKEIAELLYRAGKTNAGSVVFPGDAPISFAEWVQRKLDADPAREATADLVTELHNMIEVYWGKGDGQEPPPSCIVSARAAIAKATGARSPYTTSPSNGR